jgi:hypothetical protein
MSLELIALAFAVLGFAAIALRFLPRDDRGVRRLPRVVHESIGMWALRRLLGRPTDTTVHAPSDLPEPSAEEIAWRIGVAGAPPPLPTRAAAAAERPGSNEKGASAVRPAAIEPPAPRPATPLPPAELVAAATAILERRTRPARPAAAPRSALGVQRRVAVLVALAFAAASIAALGLSSRDLDGAVLSVTGSPQPAHATVVPSAHASVTPMPAANPNP